MGVAQNMFSRNHGWKWPDVKSIAKRVRNFFISRPWLTRAITLLVLAVTLAIIFAYLSSPAIVTALGFGALGVLAGSIAAGIQSIVYGGFVPAGSIFAVFQSFGAR